MKISAYDLLLNGYTDRSMNDLLRAFRSAFHESDEALFEGILSQVSK